MRELLHKQAKDQSNKQDETIKEEVTMNTQLVSKKGNLLKIMECTAAALVVTAGLTAGGFALRGMSDKPSQVTSITATPAVTTKVADRTFYQLKEGKNYIDLDLDGKKEEIELKNSPTGTSMVDFVITLGNQTIKGSVDREEGLKLRAAALTKEAASIQLLFTHQYFSDDYLTDVYNYENKQLVKVGTFCDEVDNIKVAEDGSFAINQPGGILGTWKDSTVHMVKNTNVNSEITGNYSLEETTAFDKEIKFEYKVKTIMDVKLYKSMDRNSGYAAQLKVGDKAKTIKVVDGKWLYLETESGEEGYLEVNFEDFIIAGTAVKGWEVFDGLPFAG
ncbi:MAG: hypothetical protein Q4G58_11260 [bacterium]|nr:hypothetical protein [bacterium]